VRSAIDGGRASERGSRDHVQMIAASHGAPKRSETPKVENIAPGCLRPVALGGLQQLPHRIFTTWTCEVMIASRIEDRMRCR
jgi:hypothetical protein